MSSSDTPSSRIVTETVVTGTHQGAVQPRHLDYYLDEFTFRFNRRTSRSRGLLLYRLLEQTVVTNPVTYYNIVRDKR